MSATPKIWLITGANAGFGRAMLSHILAQGDTAIAAVRRPDTLVELQKKIGERRLFIVKMDVTKPDEVAAAFERIKNKVGRIDVLYNNAGYPNMGEVEAMSFETARELFDCNFWGAVDVMRRTTEFMREVNKPVGGRILNMSSMYGACSDWLSGFYSASKHALEAISTALSKEVEDAWNIKVTLVEPGLFLTDAFSPKADPTAKSYEIVGHPAYTGGTAAVRQFFAANDPASFITGDPVKLSAVVYRAANMADPPLYLPLGKDAHEKIKAKLEQHLKDMDACKEWTTDLDF